MERKIVFKNGLRAVLVPIDGMYSVATGMLIDAGCVYENAENNGISHFIEHTLFKGTKNRDSFEISDAIDSIGGQINAYTSKEYTCYYTKTTSEYLETSLDLLSDMLLNSLFEKVELDKERGVVLEEIAMTEDTPDDVCLEQLSSAYFGDHTLGQAILGPRENIERINKADIEKYMKVNYAPNNIVISIAGCFDMEKAAELIEKYFVDQNPNESFILTKPSIPTPNNAFSYKEKDIEQCHLAFAQKAIPYNDPKTYHYMILGNIFGGTMTSRLFRSIREEKGLAYTVLSYNSVYANCGTNVVYAGVNPKNVLQTTEAIRTEFLKLKKDKITKEEFERGKAQTVGAYLFSQENTVSIMNIYGKAMLFSDELFNMQNRIKRMKSITYDEVCDIIDDYCDLSTISASLVGKSYCDIMKAIKGE